ncbi:MAG: chemotaxis protein CheC [Acidobacteriota bacterium]
MDLTEQTGDSLTELFHIGFARAAFSLSELTGKRVSLDAPKVSIHPLHELPRMFNLLEEDQEMASIHQFFSGEVAGNSLLLLDYEGARHLCGLLNPARVTIQPLVLDDSDCEVLTEVGNILLNACLGTFGNILKIHISFMVPKMHVQSIPALFDSLVIDKKELHYAIIAFTRFQVRDSSIGGHLVIVVGISSLKNLMDAIERLD